MRYKNVKDQLNLIIGHKIFLNWLYKFELGYHNLMKR